MKPATRRVDPPLPARPMRPPKPPHLQPVREPLYVTTFPEYDLDLTLEIEPKFPIKGILKQTNTNIYMPLVPNGVKKCAYTTEETYSSLSSEKVGYFDFEVHEPKSVVSKEASELNAKPKVSPRKSSKKNKKENSKENNKEKRTKERVKKRKSSINYTHNSYQVASKSARIEALSSLLHFFVIILCTITIGLMTKLSSEWEISRMRCPLYVKNSPELEVYWGNEKLAACRYVSFVPALVLIISLTLLILRGGVLCSWRKGGETSKLLLSTTYAKVILGIEIFELVIAITVASVLTDGFRQTCVGFQLYPWYNERPENCKAGYDGRDDAYGISHTYARLVTSMVTSWITTILIMLSSLLYFTRDS